MNGGRHCYCIQEREKSKHVMLLPISYVIKKINHMSLYRMNARMLSGNAKQQNIECMYRGRMSGEDSEWTVQQVTSPVKESRNHHCKLDPS
jgi:hypothetical protein